MFGLFKKKKVDDNQEKEISVAIDYNDVAPIARYFKEETGVLFDEQSAILKNKVTTFCRQREIASFSELLKKVQVDSKTKQELIDALTTNETFFYREFKQIEELTQLVRDTAGHVDILCAPSATGEEPYSIAIALLEIGISPSNFSIVGIDINSDALNKAQKAVYKERNVRNLSQQVISKYFSTVDDKYLLKESVKSLVTFKKHNLFDTSFKSLGKFDFVFSRNMLIYFDKETKIKAKEILENMRKDNKHEVFFGHADLF